MPPEKIIVANWKMNLLPSEEKTLLTSYLTLNTPKKIIIASSFFSLEEISTVTSTGKNVFSCGQTCSSYEHGAHTGDISAAQLASLSVPFCLVGHTERKKLWREDETRNSEQITQLLKKKITPIICLENPSQEASFIKKIAMCTQTFTHVVLYFAFEPAGAIGSGSTPPLEEIKKEVLFLKKTLGEENILNFKILYGGSVSGDNADQIMNIEGIDGLLVGGKSLIFQEFKKIVN